VIDIVLASSTVFVLGVLLVVGPPSSENRYR
jgi:hypothetical protein